MAERAPKRVATLPNADSRDGRTPPARRGVWDDPSARTALAIAAILALVLVALLLIAAS